MSSIPLLTTDGVAHGRRFAEEIAANVATYLRRFAASGLDRVEDFVEAETWRKAIAAQSPGYAEEMRGIAEGCGQSEQAIALLNARYELAFTLFGQEATRQRAGADELLVEHEQCGPGDDRPSMWVRAEEAGGALDARWAFLAYVSTCARAEAAPLAAR